MPPDSRNSPLLRTVVADAPKGNARDRGIFTVTGGAEVGRLVSIPEGHAVSFGRSDEATVQLSDVSLSRIHAKVTRLHAEFILQDCGSTNGTYVNDRRIAEAVRLQDGDRVQLGSATTLRFSLVDSAEEQALRKVYEAAMKDGLTGIANRKHLEERLDQEIAFALRQGSELSIVMMDVDHFKKVNDTYGHLAGDSVLKHMAQSLQKCLRSEDLVARYGGEEFVIVARGVDVKQTRAVADRVRLWLSQLPITFEGKQITITASAGVASLACCGDKPDKTNLLAIADSRLYQAKRLGRNRVVGPGEG